MVKEYLEKHKEEIKNCIEDLKNKDTWYKQIPNLLTFSRAIGGPIISTIFLLGYPVAGTILTASLLLTDLIDGKLARRFGVVSSFGADLDAFCDKIMFLGLSVPLIVSNPLVLLNFIFEGAISGVNVLGRINGLDTKTVFAGKVKTCILSLMLGVGYLVQYFNVPVVFLNTLVGVTFVSQSVALLNYIKEYRRMSDEKVDKVFDTIEPVIKEEKCYEEEKSLTDELRREKEFLLSVKEPNQEVLSNVRRRVR